MFAHRSIYHDGWRAVCPFPGTSFAEAGVSFGMLELTEDKLRELDATGWELYHVEVDPAETKDLAEQERAKLIEMIALWYTEAGKYNVLPLDSRGTMRFADERPQIAAERDTYVYFPARRRCPRMSPRRSSTARTPSPSTPRSRMATKVCWPATAAMSVATSSSCRTASCTTCTTMSVPRNSGCPPINPVPAGKHALRYEFEPTGPPDLMEGKGTPGIAKLFVDGELVGQADFPVTIPLALGLGSGFAVGGIPGRRVGAMYASPFPFTGTITKVTVDVSGKPDHDEAETKKAEARVAMARQ